MTIFTRIIQGEIPSYKIAENDKFYAFLDINPLQKGHTLVVPKLAEPEADYIFDLEEDMLREIYGCEIIPANCLPYQEYSIKPIDL